MRRSLAKIAAHVDRLATEHALDPPPPDATEAEQLLWAVKRYASPRCCWARPRCGPAGPARARTDDPATAIADICGHLRTWLQVRRPAGARNRQYRPTS